MGSLSFTDQESEKIEEIIGFYNFVKEQTVYNETIDSNSSTYPKIMNEIAIAYDYLNKILSQKLSSEQINESNINDLNEILNHIHNAAGENLDWLYLEVRKCANEKLKPHSNEAINACIPEYYSTIKPTFFEYRDKIDHILKLKGKETIRSEQLLEIERMRKELIEIRKKIIKNLSSLKEYQLKEKSKETEQTKEEKKGSYNRLLKEIVIGVIIVIIGAFICVKFGLN